MALTGQLTDLSLAELIEFFCNQRKTGRLKVTYPQGPGYFYIQAGTLVDAKIGVLSGVEAVYFALTLPNASFKFSPVFEATRRTIHQPWTQVVLEGLRRIDEGITPFVAFPENGMPAPVDDVLDGITENEVEGMETFKTVDDTPATPLSLMVENASQPGRSKTLIVGAVAVALLASVAVIGIPAGWYHKAKTPAVSTATASVPATLPAEQSNNNSPAAQPLQTEESQPAEASAIDAATPNNEANLAARREREARDRERLLRAAEERANNNTAAKQSEATSTHPATPNADASAAKKPETAKAGPKMVSVQVTYDEAGRVTQASGGDSSALRIARQKRFPTGKPGSTTITIPIN